MIKLLLFDLGGVIVDIPTLDEIRAALRLELRDAESEARWLDARVWRQFESGRWQPEEFAPLYINEWALTFKEAELLGEIETWVRRILPGVEELLAELRPRYRLAALSNSNPLHWRLMTESMGVMALFERAFSSHQIGHLKPNREIFEHALRELGVQPHEVVFFDDTQVNVEAAQALGIRAYTTRGVEELRQRIAEVTAEDE